MVLGSEDLGKWLDQEGETFMHGISVKKTQRNPLPLLPCEVTVGQMRRGLSMETKNAGALTLDFSSSKILRNKFLLFANL